MLNTKGEFGIDDNYLRPRIALAYKKLRSIDWPWDLMDKEAADNDPAILIPIAYAAFRFLMESVGHTPDEWNQFMRDALEEAISTYGDATCGK